MSFRWRISFASGVESWRGLNGCERIDKTCCDWPGGCSGGARACEWRDLLHSLPALADAERADWSTGLSEARKTADEGFVQGARCAESNCDAYAGTGSAGRGGGERGKSCTGCGLSC